MTATVFAAVIAAAAMHAGWNALLKVRLDPFLALMLVTSCSGIAALPLLFAFGWPRAEAWPWLLASVALHLGYYTTLTEAYRRADMGQIYPIARGGAPLLTAIVSITVLQEPLGTIPALGVAVLAGGVILMSSKGRRIGTVLDPVAVSFALATAAIICGYTLVDGLGARTAGDPHAYSATLFVLGAVPLPLITLWRRGLSGMKPALGFLLPALAGGAMSLGAYWIAIWAMTVAPIALVAALRESSVLFAALIAALVLKEPLAPIRVVAATLILVGLLLIRWH